MQGSLRLYSLLNWTRVLSNVSNPDCRITKGFPFQARPSFFSTTLPIFRSASWKFFMSPKRGIQIQLTLKLSSRISHLSFLSSLPIRLVRRWINRLFYGEQRQPVALAALGSLFPEGTMEVLEKHAILLTPTLRAGARYPPSRRWQSSLSPRHDTRHAFLCCAISRSC